MPYIEVKLSSKTDENKKNVLQSKLTDTVSLAFSKPKAYIMANIEDSSSLFMGGEKREGAYVSISLLGSATKSVCQDLTKNVCEILSSELNIEGRNIYVTYHPIDLWGWNGAMF